VSTQPSSLRGTCRRRDPGAAAVRGQAGGVAGRPRGGLRRQGPLLRPPRLVWTRARTHKLTNARTHAHAHTHTRRGQRQRGRKSAPLRSDTRKRGVSVAGGFRPDGMCGWCSSCAICMIGVRACARARMCACACVYVCIERGDGGARVVRERARYDSLAGGQPPAEKEGQIETEREGERGGGGEADRETKRQRQRKRERRGGHLPRRQVVHRQCQAQTLARVLTLKGGRAGTRSSTSGTRPCRCWRAASPPGRRPACP
jgi:hypothetical protein